MMAKALNRVHVVALTTILVTEVGAFGHHAPYHYGFSCYTLS